MKDEEEEKERGEKRGSRKGNRELMRRGRERGKESKKERRGMEGIKMEKEHKRTKREIEKDADFVYLITLAKTHELSF